MKNIPIITVQLIHIEGPSKGSIEEFTDHEITFGRDASCHVKFPKELNFISRNHAKIIRKGNRFKLIDESTNGILVNGKQIQQTYLNDGDVIFFTEIGPKLSFLKEISNETMSFNSSTDSGNMPAPPSAPPPPPLQKKIDPPKKDVQAGQQMIIQYGLGILSFQQFPIIIGNNPDCDFKLQEQDICNRHAEIALINSEYIVTDLTGQNIVKIDGIVANNSKLNTGSILALLPSGPFFKFVGEGRLMEIDPQGEQDTSKKNSYPKDNKSEDIGIKKSTKNAAKTKKTFFHLFKKS